MQPVYATGTEWQFIFQKSETWIKNLSKETTPRALDQPPMLQMPSISPATGQ